MRLSISEIMAATGAEGDISSCPGLLLESVSMDSRKAGPGSLFACLPGARADGHDFAAQAVAGGAAAVLAARAVPGLDDIAVQGDQAQGDQGQGGQERDGREAGPIPVLMVPDVQRALGGLARFWRRRTRPLLAALSGSAGKTTVKELLGSIASRLDRSVKNPGNWNNQLGLPLAMLAATEEDRIWVQELGISRLGDMEELAAICEPDLAVVHNIGPAHLEGLGDLRGVARAKAALFTGLKSGGIGLAGMDYPELWSEAQAVLPRVLGMSTRNPEAPYFARSLGADAQGRTLVELTLEGETFQVLAPWRGAHLAENVLAAAAVAWMMGARPTDIALGVAQATLPSGRFDVRQVAGWTVIDDTYNANPLSMCRAIETARELAGGRPLVLVLGGMGELGEQAASAHEELGRCIAAVGQEAGRAGPGCRSVFFHGEQAGLVEKGLSQGHYQGAFTAVKSPEEFAQCLRSPAFAGLEGGGAVLFKGSRSQRMEDFLDRFLAEIRDLRGGAR